MTLVLRNFSHSKWIDVLSYFLLPKQHALASSTVAVGLKNFIADLSLQGLVVTEKVCRFMPCS